MALTMDSGSLRELSAASSGRQDSASGAPPFSHSRLRGYAGRVDGMLDPKIVLGSSIALTAAGMADPFHTGGEQSPRTLAQQQQHPPCELATASPAAARSSAGAGQQPQNGALHARFAPSVLPSAAAAAAVAAGGGGSQPLRFAGRASESQLPPPPPGSVAGSAATGVSSSSSTANPEDLAAALTQIQALKAEIAGVETVLGYLKGSETNTTTLGRKAHKLPSQEQLRARADALAASRAATRLGGSGAGPSIDSLLLTPLRSSVAVSVSGSPARARSAGDAPASAAAASGAPVFDALAAETKLGRTWRVPRGPQPVGRGEAVILEAALDEALPSGAITAKYGSGAAVELSFWSGGDVRQDFDMLDMVQREVARQVSVSCGERGRIIEKLADRHSEIFLAVVAAAKAAAEAQRNLTDELAAVRARAVEQASEIASLRSELAGRGAESEDLREQLAEATTAHEHYVWDAEQELERLQGQADILAAEVEHLHVRLSEAVAEKDAALSQGLERLEGDLAAVTDERDDLAQRIRFLERQLHKLRSEMNASVETESVEVQTDPIDWGPPEEEDVPDDSSDTPSLAEIRARYAALGYGALTPEERIRLGLPPHLGPDPSKEHKGRKRKRPLGHFEGLISSDKPGRIRGLPWTMNAISAIYYDKTHADSVSDREGRPRQRLADFAVDWHMTRFGLRNLAELHLLDLIASVRHHYKTSVRVRWFGQFTGLVEVGDSVDTTPHVSFYLTVLAALAAPNSLVSLFPDTGGEEGGGTPPVALKAGALPEATRAVFRYLGEPEAAGAFLGRCVDPLTDPVSQLVPLDPLLALFMAEYQKRWERNAAHLRALFRAGDFDDDGLVGYDEFAAVVRQLIPDAGERLVSKWYNEAVRRLPEGQSLVDSDTFMSVARSYGWDRWRIEVGGAASTSGGGGGSNRSLPWTASAALSQPGLYGSTSGVPPGLAAAAAAAVAGAGPGGGGGGPGGAVSRSESAMARTALSAATLGSGLSIKVPTTLATAASAAAAATAAAAPLPCAVSRTVSNLRRENSVVGLSDADRAVLRVLDGALEGLDPPLEEQVGSLLDKLRTAVATAQQQASAVTAALSAVPGLEMGSSARDLTHAIAADTAMITKLEAQFSHFQAVYSERTEPTAAWLAFRLLLASLAAATAGSRPRNSRSRPASAKGTVGWALPRNAMRLTVPPLPFRAGTSARALTTGGGAAAAAAALSGSRCSPSNPGGGQGQGQGLGSGPGSGMVLGPPTGSLQHLLSGVSTYPSSSAGGGGGGGGSGEVMRAATRSPSPLQRCSSRSTGHRSPDLPGRPTGLAQLIQGSSARGSFAERPSPPRSPTPLVIPSATVPVPLHRSPLPATLSSATRGSALAPSPGASITTSQSNFGSGLGTPSKRGVMFALEMPSSPPQSTAAADDDDDEVPGVAMSKADIVAPVAASAPGIQAADGWAGAEAEAEALGQEEEAGRERGR